MVGANIKQKKQHFPERGDRETRALLFMSCIILQRRNLETDKGTHDILALIYLRPPIFITAPSEYMNSCTFPIGGFNDSSWYGRPPVQNCYIIKNKFIQHITNTTRKYTRTDSPHIYMYDCPGCSMFSEYPLSTYLKQLLKIWISGQGLIYLPEYTIYI